MKASARAVLAWLASFRLRIVFRTAFLLLALAVVAMALVLLREEKQRSYDHYQSGIAKTKEQIVARLRHPSGQLALLNPDRGTAPGRPVMLPFAALDFDDQGKVRNAIEMSGCLVPYPRNGSLCVAIGTSPWAGGFLYAAGTFASSDLVAHDIGKEVFDGAHRLRVTFSRAGETSRWIAPFEALPAAAAGGQRGRFTGYLERDGGAAGANYKGARPLREFRAWVWQGDDCIDGSPPACEKKSFFSLRLPVEALREALFQGGQPAWPPADLERFGLRIEVLAPGDGPAPFDSDSEPASPPFVLGDLGGLLLPGETLILEKAGDGGGTDAEVVHLNGREQGAEPASPLLLRLIDRLPVERIAAPVALADEIATPLGSYRLRLKGDARGVNQALGVVATRLSWFVVAMLGAVGLAWLVIEIGLARPIARMTRRARGLSRTVHGDEDLERYDFADLRGSDELGLLAAGLDDLLRRVRVDSAREHLRAAQEKDMWHAVGHEIMSPLQSLLALHGRADDPSQRYLRRMQQAVRVLYGSASPSEAFEGSRLQVQSLDLAAFLHHVTENAGIADVRYEGPDSPVPVRADEYPLEDVFSHLLRNADRHRRPGSAITLALAVDDSQATVAVHNQGLRIADDRLGRIFEYGVSDQTETAGPGNRGQGLFVARTYLAKMGGTIAARNEPDGVSFVLTLQRARG